MTTQPDHELLWLSCAAKRCCSIRTVRPTGGDIWRIATQLHVPPDSFLRTIPAAPAADDAVLLAADTPPLHVALARRATKSRQAACIFLMHIGDDVARCGLGELRPLVCRAFPAVSVGGRLGVSPEHGCSCRTWTIGDLDRRAAGALLGADAAERALDRQLIGDWNAQLVAEARSASLADFCDYLIQSYTRYAAEGIV